MKMQYGRSRVEGWRWPFSRLDVAWSPRHEGSDNDALDGLVLLCRWHAQHMIDREYKDRFGVNMKIQAMLLAACGKQQYQQEQQKELRVGRDDETKNRWRQVKSK